MDKPDPNDLLRSLPNRGRQFPHMTEADEDYLQALLQRVRERKPYLVAAQSTDGSIKFISGNMSLPEKIKFLTKILQSWVEHLNND